jgi:hypothetical protein
MAAPTAADPLGQRPDPASFAEAMEKMIDARIDARLTGRTSDQFKNVGDLALVHELIARGWAVFHPGARLTNS